MKLILTSSMFLFLFSSLSFGENFADGLPDHFYQRLKQAEGAFHQIIAQDEQILLNAGYVREGQIGLTINWINPLDRRYTCKVHFRKGADVAVLTIRGDRITAADGGPSHNTVNE